MIYFNHGKGSKVLKAERPKVKRLVAGRRAVMATERFRELCETCFLQADKERKVNKMNIVEMENKARELQELRRMKEELEAEIESLQDEIKAGMGDAESITAGAFRISWKAVTSSRIDSKALKATLPDIAARFIVTSTIKRFTVQ